MLLLTIAIQTAAVAGTPLRPSPNLAKTIAGAGLEPTIVVVEGDNAGLLDRTGSNGLHVSAAALELARTDAERTALISIALSYKIGDPAAASSSKAANILTGLAGAYADEAIAGRDRSDPYLKLPTTPRRWERAQEPNQKTVDRKAVRALAWAQTAGSCEAATVAFLDRLVAVRADHPKIGADAQYVRNGLGLLRFNPDTRCPA